jgi:hypothetical protein
MTSHRGNLDAALADLPRPARRALKKAILRDSARCGICREPYPHAGRTWSGLLADGKAATACEQCVGRLQAIYFGGIYLSKQYPGTEALANSWEAADGQPRRRVPAIELDTHLAEMQRLLRQEEDEYAARHRRICRQSGLSETALDQRFVNRGEPWREDDRLWFEAHADRSFRMREIFPGEFDELQRHQAIHRPVADGRRPVVVVCQTQPGERVRAICDLPDHLAVVDRESVAETLFEHVRRGTGEIQPNQIIEEAMALESLRAELQPQ